MHTKTLFDPLNLIIKRIKTKIYPEWETLQLKINSSVLSGGQTDSDTVLKTFLLQFTF